MIKRFKEGQKVIRDLKRGKKLLTANRAMSILTTNNLGGMPVI